MARIGVQLMMLKDEMAADGPYKTLRRLTEIGFGVVEVSQIPMTPDNVSEMQRAREELGIDFAALSAIVGDGTGAANDSLTTDYDKIVQDAKILDSKMVRIGMMPFDAMGSEDALLEFCREADQAAVRLAGDGIKLYYHNHHIEFARIGDRFMLDVIRENAPNMDLEIDVHWVQRGGKDPVRILQKYEGLVDLVHLKDYRIGALDPSAFEALGSGDRAGFMRAFLDVVQFAEVGEGTLEWNEIIDQSIASGAKYLLIEQDEQYGRDPFDCLAISRQNLVNLGYENLL